MEKLFYKYPETIGEELEAQIKYCKYIGTIKNTADLSTAMRDKEKEIFGKKREYTNHKYTVRPATITELKKVGICQEIPNYLLLFSAFKALNIIKEEWNIIRLLDSYGISPSKKIDKEILVEKRKAYSKLGVDNIRYCSNCLNYDKYICKYKEKCIPERIKQFLKVTDIDARIKRIYSIGFSSNFEKILNIKHTYYYINLETFKNILNKLDENEAIKEIETVESDKNKECKKNTPLLIRVNECKKKIEESDNIIKYLRIDKKNLEKLIQEENRNRKLHNTLTNYEEKLDSQELNGDILNMFLINSVKRICKLKNIIISNR